MVDRSFADRVKETTTTTGTGDVTLAGAASQHISFNTAFGVGPSFDYAIVGQSGTEWEVGEGHLSGSTTLVRDTVRASSNSNAAVSFSAGTKDVFCTIGATSINKLTTLAEARKVAALRL
ncbi:MAG: hypothetical protein U1E62_05370 [Alsobacter sp.]